MEVLYLLFGRGSALSVGQMSMRAAVVFCLALLLIRVSGRRSFGLHSPFDSVIAVLLGAILSRAVTGASPFVATIAAAAMLVVIHRLTGMAGQRWGWLDRIVSGTEIVLVRNGQIDDHALQQALVTEKDLEEAIRKKTGTEDVSQVCRAVLERNGEITVIPQADKAL